MPDACGSLMAAFPDAGPLVSSVLGAVAIAAVIAPYIPAPPETAAWPVRAAYGLLTALAQNYRHAANGGRQKDDEPITGGPNP